jgi:hypothetical protein
VNPPFAPTDEQRKNVEAMSGYGVPQDDIACILDIAPKTLRLHFRRELDVGIAKANAKIGQTLFQQATGGNTAAAIFWAKARMGWREKAEAEVDGGVTIRVVGGLPERSA